MSYISRHRVTLTIDSESNCCGSTPADDAPTSDSSPGALPESVLISALEQATNSTWRLVCALLAAEQNEPFRTCYLSKDVRDVLALWHDWQRSQHYLPPTELDASDTLDGQDFCPQSLVIDVDLLRPLESFLPRSLT